ncbi:hypothetical protein Goklo_023319, partial [Gossypium klotzschianum]|nr:hypothetical protein [Gossypium klotzschianum]
MKTFLIFCVFCFLFSALPFSLARQVHRVCCERVRYTLNDVVLVDSSSFPFLAGGIK